MGRLFIPAERKINGPWLLSFSSLKELNIVIEEISEKLKCAIDEDYKNEPEKFHNSKPSFDDKIVLTDKNKSTLSDETLEGILRDQRLKDFKPTELNVELGKSYTGYSVRLSVSQRFEHDLEYEIICNNIRFKEEIKYEIDNWVEDNKPDKASQIWASYGFTLSLYLFGALWVLLLSSILIKSPKDIEKTIRKNQAIEILNKGVDNENLHLAVELILKNQVDYTPQNTVSKVTIRQSVLKILVVSILCILLLLVNPKTTIGVGRNVKKLKFIIFWKRLVLISIPTTIFIPIILTLIKSFILN